MSFSFRLYMGSIESVTVDESPPIGGYRQFWYLESV